MLDEWVREEIAVREAMSAGLDRDDTVIRRRLRQKLEFLAEDEAEAKAPTDDELKAWLDAHAEQFRTEPRVAFRQVFVSRDRRGSSADADAVSILTRLKATGAAARTAEFGDPTMLPGEFALASLRDVDSVFGTGFAKQIECARGRRVVGPVPFGLAACTSSSCASASKAACRNWRPAASCTARSTRRAAQAANRCDVRPACSEVHGRHRPRAVRQRRAGGNVEAARGIVMPPLLRMAVAACLVVLGVLRTVHAHETRPGYLELREQEPTTYALLWKRADGRRNRRSTLRRSCRMAAGSSRQASSS